MGQKQDILHHYRVDEIVYVISDKEGAGLLFSHPPHMAKKRR